MNRISFPVASPDVLNVSFFEATPGISVILRPDAPVYTLVAVSNDFVRESGMSREAVIGKGHFEVFPASPDDPAFTGAQNLKASFEYIIRYGKPHDIPVQRYDIPVGDGTFRQRYWKIRNAPVVSDSGEVLYIIHSAADITNQVLAEHKVESTKEIEKAYNFFMNAPVIIGLVKGDDYVVELANEGLLEVWDRTSDVIGKPLLTAVPELDGQGFIELLDQVRKTGVPYYASAHPITLFRHGKEEVIYFDFVYKPFYERETEEIASGVISVGYDVTDQVIARRKLEGKNKELQFVMDVMPQMVWHTLPDGNADFFNKVFLSYTGLPIDQLTGLQWTTLLHPDDAEATVRAWQQAVSGVNDHYTAEHRLRGRDGSYRWFLTRGVPLKDEDGQIMKWYGTTTDIQEQKTANEVLKQSTERFDLVAKATQDAIWDWNLITNEIWWNDGFKELFGYKSEDIETTVDSWYNRVHPDDTERVVSGIHQVIDNGGKKWSAEYRFRRKDGSYAVVFDRGYALHNKEGIAYRMLGSMQDITERKQAEEAIRESELRFRRMANTLPLVVWTASPDGGLTFISKQWEDYYGNPIRDSLGNGWASFVHPDDVENAAAVWARSLQTGVVYETEFRVSHKNEGYRWILVRAVPIRTSDGTIQSWCGSNTDIQDKKQVEDALKQSEEQFRTLANSIYQLAWMADANGWIHWYNERWYEYTGTTLDEMKGWGWEKVHHPDHIERVVTFVKDAWRKGEPWELTFPLRSQDGTYRWFLTRSYPVKDEQGKVTQWIGTNTDIDAQKQAEVLLEEKVKERTRALEQKNKELEQFAYVSHHDLKEPIRKIMLFSEMVKVDSYDRLTEASRHRLDRVIDSAQRMSTALKDILDFASLAKTEPFSSVDLTEVLASVRSDLELMMAEKQAHLVITNLPVLRAVPGQMHQLFYNLVSNALKFSKPDLPPAITIDSRLIDAAEASQLQDLHTGRAYYQITVRDNGIGFTPDNAEKIFVMFQRLHNRKAYSGTGIGLALVRKVVTNHGGIIWAESQLGEGATFQILVPAS